MGLINPNIRKKFLARSLDNWDWLKKEKPKDVKEAFSDLKPKVKTGKLKLWVHQRVCLLLMIYLERFMLFLDMGGGKTLLTLLALQHFKRKGKPVRAVVFVPYVITTETWVEETEKWTNLNCVALTGKGADNLEKLKDPDVDLFVICYQTAVAMMAKKSKVKDKKSKKKIEWKLDAATVYKHFKGFNFIAMDEIHKCKNINSMTYRMCRAISKRATYAFGLTGTPFGKNIEDLWAQFFLIDLGETLGETLGLFRSVFFREVQNYWGGIEYKFLKKLKPTLTNVIKHRSIRYTIQECHDMPAKQEYIRKVKPNADVATYYNKIIEGLEKLSFDRIKYRQLESEYNKLQQLASGFMTLKGDDDKKAQVQFPDNPKLDMLEGLIDAMPEDSKMIVFHHFRYTNNIISERLKKMKIPHARVWGGAKNGIAELRRFKKDKKCRVLVINTQSGSSSQNLQMANYVVYFEQPRGSVDSEQSKRRAWRPGQTKKVLFFHLIMEGTYDERQLKANEEGTDLLKDILDTRHKPRKLLV